jgi:hypothetical protein
MTLLRVEPLAQSFTPRRVMASARRPPTLAERVTSGLYRPDTR